MNREPIGLYLFRIFLSMALLGVMLLLYWSSLLQEEDLKEVQTSLHQMKGQLDAIQEDLHQKEFSTVKGERPQSTIKRPHLSDEYPNLLSEDPFYKTTLSKLLPSSFTPWGTFHFDNVGRPDNLHPFSNWAIVSTWTSQCLGSVAKLEVGKFETFAQDMAIKMEDRRQQGTNRPEYWIHLREGMFWEPLKQQFFPDNVKLAPHFLKKHPVTAHDFKFYFDALKNPFNQEPGAVAARTYYNDLEEVEVLDDLTFIVRWKTEEVEINGKKEPRTKYTAKQLTGGLNPLASFVYKYFHDGKKIIEDDRDPKTYRTNSVWAQNFAQHWAKNVIPSCGGWSFNGMNERQISFERNKNYYNPLDVLAQSSVTEFKESLEALWQDFKALKTDTYSLQPSQLIELDQFLHSDIYAQQKEKGNAIKRVDYLARQFGYIGWNLTKPYFKSRKVRQALTMAIDRQRIIREFLNGMGIEITSTFFKTSPSNDPSIIPLPYDLDQAKRNLQEEGWVDVDGSGIISKMIDGKKIPFKFNLTYYVKNTTSKVICEFVSTSLKELGIQCNLNGVDVADLSAVFDDKSFDALQLNWTMGTPPEDPRQLWHSAGAKEKGSSNMIGFANAEVDKIIDALSFEYNQQRRIELYHRFNRIIYDEQPYTFLYTPKIALLYREYVQNVFIPVDRQDLIPGANVAEPIPSVFWLQRR